MLFRNNIGIRKVYTTEVWEKIYPIVVDMRRGIQDSESITFMTADTSYVS